MNEAQKILSLLLIAACMHLATVIAHEPEPVNRNASTEARALLKLLYEISGKYTLTGQHNYPNIKDRNTLFAARYTGKTPAVFSTDWGFAGDGDTDSYLARPDIVQEAIRQHQLGSVITICWHAAPPTADEPVTFRPQPETPSDSLASVQGRLTDRQFRDVLTPGTHLYHRWCRQVDSVAVYLKKLQDAHVPVLWRPYHEMNGDWFWWGGRTGEYSTEALYRQLFNRFTQYHNLDNLLWVWSVDRFHNPQMYYSLFHPGNEYLDVLALDVYNNDFNKAYYDSLLALSKGKPVILAEVGNPPSPEILQEQPRWGLYVIWAGMVRNTLKKQYQVLLNDPRVISQEDPAYQKIMEPFRSTCGLFPLPPRKKTDFSGEWILNEEHSSLDLTGTTHLPCKLRISKEGEKLKVERTFQLEYAEDRITTDTIATDGREHHSVYRDFPVVATARFTACGDTLVMESKLSLQHGDHPAERITREYWNLLDHGHNLRIEQYKSPPWGQRNIILVYDRQ